MGRKKLALDFIKNKKARKTTFEKRKKGLMKKAEEFSIRCDVDTCVIIYSPDDSPGREPAIWPQDPERVKQVIHRYFNEGAERRSRHAVGLSELFMARKRKIENELAKVRAANLAAKHSVSHELIKGLSSLDQCRDVQFMVEKKLEGAKKRLLAAKETAAVNSSRMVHVPMIGPSTLLPPSMDMDLNLMMRPHVGSSLASTTGRSNILANSQNNNIYSFTVPAYNRNRNFTQFESFPTYKSSMGPMDQYNRMRGAHPLPENTTFNCSGQGMLGNTSSMMTNVSMMWPHVGDSLTNTSSSSRNIAADHQSSNNYSLTVPAYGRSFSQSTSFPAHQSSMVPMDQYNQVQGAHSVPENAMFDGSGQGMLLGSASSAMTMVLPQQQPLMPHYPMMQQGNTDSTVFTSFDQGHTNSTSSATLNQMAEFHDSDNCNQQFFALYGGNSY